jgi:uroporphyrinogen-III synthase
VKAPEIDALPLEGFVVGVTADRRAREQTQLLERRGADVVHGPVIRTLPLGPEEGLRAATEALIEHPPDDVVASTGIGMRSWFSAAESWGRDDALLGALRNSRFLARGPKAAAALHVAGMKPAWRAPGEQLAEVVEHLLAAGVAGRRIALQQAGDGDNPAASRLRAAGADVLEVPVYRWTRPLDDRPARRLIEAACRGSLHAVTFTTAPAVDALFDIAEEDRRSELLQHVLNGPVTVVCVGPVCAGAARARGVRVPVEPHPARLGSMVRALTDRLADRRLRVVAAGHTIELRGSLLVVAGERARLGDPERLLLETLVQAGGRVVDHAQLMRATWPGVDPDSHRLEAAVARLRRRLGPAASLLKTVRRRGYRIETAPPNLTGRAAAHEEPFP